MSQRGELADAPPEPGAAIQPRWLSLWLDALWVGATSFGGGYSAMALIERLAVDKRRWLTAEEFATAAAVAQMLPGGASSNLLAAVGLKLAGVRGAATLYVGYVLPGALATFGLGWAYLRYGVLPGTEAPLAGLQAAVVGILCGLTARMGRTALRRPWQMLVAVAAVALAALARASAAEVAVLGALVGVTVELGLGQWKLRARRGQPAKPAPAPHEAFQETDEQPTEHRPLHARLALLAAAPLVLPASLLTLAILFFRTGLGAFGGGYAVIAGLQEDLLAAGWVTAPQMANAIAAGKLTPGPVLLMATFIGYLRAGPLGALVATASIFAAPFVLVVGFATWLERVRRRRWVRGAVRGLTPAIVGLLAASTLSLGAGLDRPSMFAVTVLAAGLTLVSNASPTVLLAMGAIAGALTGRLGL